MEVKIFNTKQEMGEAAARKAAQILKKAIEEKGEAVFVAATGTSQFEFLEYLIKMPSIDWSRTVMFHMDEYIGVPEDHPASFRKYLKKRLVDKVHPRTVHFVNGDTKDPSRDARG